MTKLIVIFLLASCSANAQIARSHYTSFGASDCGQWLDGKARSQKETWLLGLLTGLDVEYQALSVLHNDPLDALNSAPQAFLWMDNYCRSNPLKNVTDGALDLFAELIMKKK